MLKVKSFKFSDDAGINDILSNYRLAQGASIFVSNGEICIPYEDGEPMNKAQKTISIKEKINTLQASIEVIEHTITIDNTLLDKVTERLNEVEADFSEAKAKKTGKDAYDTEKEYTARLTELQKGISEVKNRIMTNEQEVLRMETEIEIYEEEIAGLSA
jgi:chromosome segregation ATPase